MTALPTPCGAPRPRRPRDLSGVRNALGTELADERGEAKVLNGAVLMFDQGSPFIHECMVEFNRTYRIDSWGWNGPELVTRVASRFPQGPQLHILPTSAFYAIHWAKARRPRRHRGGPAPAVDAPALLPRFARTRVEAAGAPHALFAAAAPPGACVPFPPQVAKYFTDEDLDDQHKVWAEMERDTFLFHYWNKVTVNLRPKPGSLMYKAREPGNPSRIGSGLTSQPAEGAAVLMLGAAVCVRRC